MSVTFYILAVNFDFQWTQGPSWSYDGWIYNYLCNQCRSH